MADMMMKTTYAQIGAELNSDFRSHRSQILTDSNLFLHKLLSLHQKLAPISNPVDCREIDSRAFKIKYYFILFLKVKIGPLGNKKYVNNNLFLPKK